jgi:DHA1 family inner membrane transport protein
LKACVQAAAFPEPLLEGLMSLDQLTAPAPARAGRERVVPVRVSLFALALGGFGIGTTEFVTMGVLPDIAAGVGVSIPRAGQLVAVYALAVVIGAPLVAVLGARLPRRTMLVALMAFFTVGNLASALAPSFATLMAARFASGLPHGAYFGMASVVAASLVPVERRARAVSMMMLGLMVATLVGVPLSALVGQQLGWRSTYWTVTAIGCLTILAVLRWVPQVHALPGASPRQELGALRRPQVWLSLAVGGIGCAGFFAVYSYITPTLTEVAGFPKAGVPIALALFGLGMTLGTIVGGHLADRWMLRTMGGGLASFLVMMLVFTVTAHAVGPAAVTVFLLGFTGTVMNPALATRLMDVAGEAQSLAASLTHASLNVGNALGAWIGGVVIAAGFGYTSPALAGAGLAVIGLVIIGASGWLDRPRHR